MLLSTLSSRRSGRTAVLGLYTASLVACATCATEAAAQDRRCKGVKVWYAGDCRYPDEVERLKAEQAEQQRAAAQQRQADEAACRAAREQNGIIAWRGYLQTFPQGSCRAEAEQRIAALEAEPIAAEPEPTEPEPAPVPTSTAPAEPEVPPPPPPPRPSDGVSPFAWVGIAVGAAGLLTWGITGAVSLSMSSDLKDDCIDDVCPPERESDLDTATALAHVATVGLVVGAVGASVGIIALVASGGDDAAASAGGSDRHTVSIRPYLGPGSAGVVGSF